ncbi:MAG: efflux RND transporter periplasmic adaptor subunit [Fusobacteriaceae bacterium]
MKYKKKLILTFFILVLISTGCGKKESIESVRPVKLFTVEAPSNRKILKFIGEISSGEKTTLSFKVPGRIEKLYFQEGAKVIKGEIIATLDKEDFSLNLKAFENKLIAAKNGYVGKEAMYTNANQQFKRVKKLYEAKAISKKNYDDVFSKEKGAKAGMLASLAVMNEAKAGLEKAKNSLSDIKLKAPYTGYLVKKFAGEGEVVNGGTAIFSMISNANPEVKIGVSPEQLEELKEINSIKITLNEKDYKLKIKEIAYKKDVVRLYYPVTLEFEETIQVRDGASGEVTIEKISKDTQIKIPITSIFEENGSNVWLYTNNSEVIKKSVNILGIDEKGLISVTGLSKDDKIVASGTSFLVENQKVKPFIETEKSNIGGII